LLPTLSISSRKKDQFIKSHQCKYLTKCKDFSLYFSSNKSCKARLLFHVGIVNTTRAARKTEFRYLHSIMQYVIQCTVLYTFDVTGNDREGGFTVYCPYQHSSRNTESFCSLCKANTIIHCLPIDTCSFVDRHLLDADPDPTFNFDADPDTDLDTDPNPRALHMLENQKKFFFLIHQQCQIG
jgi:hypothetical protein